jgi:bleomycin hydrolase
LRQLREFALELRGIYTNTRDHHLNSRYGPRGDWRKTANSACRERKSSQLYAIFSILSLALGKPPALGQKLKFEYYDKDKKFQTFEKTAVEIYESLAPEFVVQDCIMLAHDASLPTHRAVVSENSLFNIMGYKPTRFVNVDIDLMEKMVIEMIKADRPVWFACQVETFSDSASGVMDTKLYDFMAALGTGLNMSKQDVSRAAMPCLESGPSLMLLLFSSSSFVSLPLSKRLLTRDAWPTHAMGE